MLSPLGSCNLWSTLALESIGNICIARPFLGIHIRSAWSISTLCVGVLGIAINAKAPLRSDLIGLPHSHRLRLRAYYL